MTDRERIIAAGLTEAEADCWELAATLAGTFFQLPPLHPSAFAHTQQTTDQHEVSHAIHVVQNKLLARPVYRQYIHLAHEEPSELGG